MIGHIRARVRELTRYFNEHYTNVELVFDISNTEFKIIDPITVISMSNEEWSRTPPKYHDNRPHFVFNVDTYQLSYDRRNQHFTTLEHDWRTILQSAYDNLEEEGVTEKKSNAQLFILNILDQ